MAGGCETGWMCHRAVEGRSALLVGGPRQCHRFDHHDYYWDDFAPALAATSWDKVNLLNTFALGGLLLVTTCCYLRADVNYRLGRNVFFRRAG